MNGFWEDLRYGARRWRKQALFTVLAAISSTILALMLGAPIEAKASDERPLAILQVNVIPLTREVVWRDQTVIVRQGKIAQIGPAATVRVPREALRIDGRGKYLMPGLTDFHVHLRDQSELVSYLFHGVTTVVHLSGPTQNVPDVFALRRRIAAGEVIGPNVYATGKVLDGNPPIFPRVSTVVGSAEAARRVVAEQQRDGADFIKVYNNLEPDVLKAIVAEAHQRGLAVVGHIPRKAGRPQALQAALGAGQDMIAHAEELFFTFFYGDTDSLLERGLPPQPDRSQIPQAIQWLRRSGAYVTPNLSFSAMLLRQLDDLNAVLADPEANYLHPATLAVWRQQNPTRRADRARFELRERAKYAFLLELTRALQAGGVPLLLGTDATAPGLFPGQSAQLELRELVKAGLTPFQALTTGTRTAGQFVKRHLRNATDFGTVTRGARADLLLLEANPLTDIAHLARLAGVVVNGRWLSQETLVSMRDEARRSFNQP